MAAGESGRHPTPDGEAATRQVPAREQQDPADARSAPRSEVKKQQASDDSNNSDSGRESGRCRPADKQLDLELLAVAGPNGPQVNSKSCNHAPDHQDKQDKQDKQQASAAAIGPTRKRYFILLMYVLLQLVKSFQWICLASVTNVVANFYQVDHLAINWTTVLFMVTFLLFALPISWLMERLGLRRSVLAGSLGVTLGLVVKCAFSCHRAGFWPGMLGHLIVGLAEPFFFSSYSQLASVWFPDHQVAAATSWAYIGEEAGLALGFVLPPLLVGADPNDLAAIQRGLQQMFLVLAAVSALNTASIYLFFDAAPKRAPGIARLKQLERLEQLEQQQQQRRRRDFAAPPKGDSQKALGAIVVKCPQPVAAGRGGRQPQPVGAQVRELAAILRDRNFLLLLAGFGLNVGTAYSIHTLLNQMIIPTAPQAAATQPLPTPSAGAQQQQQQQPHQRPANATHSWPDDAADADADLALALAAPEDPGLLAVVGNAGLILIVAGLFGSALCGSLLDRFHRYKLTSAGVYALALASMLGLALILPLEEEGAAAPTAAAAAGPLGLYLLAVPLGFALTGYASCGFDYGVELTYPRAELLSSTTLNVSAQLFGIPISLAGSRIVDAWGARWLAAFFAALLLAGLLLTCCQGGQLRRQTAVAAGAREGGGRGRTAGPESGAEAEPEPERGGRPLAR